MFLKLVGKANPSVEEVCRWFIMVSQDVKAVKRVYTIIDKVYYKS